MFSKEVYSKRRKALAAKLSSGLALFLGNTEASFNYPANTYDFRQDSDFLYFFGIDHPDLAGVIDIDSGEEFIFGNDVDMDDIIWMGNQPSMKDTATKVGVKNTFPFGKLTDFVGEALKRNRKVHYLPPYRGKNIILLGELTNQTPLEVKTNFSKELIQAVVSLRLIKEAVEVEEIEKAMEIAYHMHTTAMKMAKPGVVEREIAGVISGIASSMGSGISFPIILSINGQTLHNHYHGNVLKEGRMMVTDAGAESLLHYASDITRTVPVGGKFNTRQKEIYEIVLKANLESSKIVKPGKTNRSTHLFAAEIVATELKALGLMKGDVKEAVQSGAHALFFPHGLGHHMGLDVHDMEGLGENNVGSDDKIKRRDQFGLAFLRFGKEYEPGHVFTIEPGIYFIPALIDQWKAENKFTNFINYDKVETYKDFGGIRIEDDILVTNDGYRVLGRPIPKTVEEIEDIMK
ncbi:MAG: aminopeptidase P family protein [Bacteroidetes bacterium]|nr:MAG: aminopeptidase P family protein [Bacteroidota bacterium]